jgi:small neutral amino acid transporter SnatA (MarC family)
LQANKLNTPLLFIAALLAAVIAINEMYSSARNPIVLVVSMVIFWIAMFLLLRSEKVL